MVEAGTLFKQVARGALPAPVRRWIQRRRQSARPDTAVAAGFFGRPRRLEPVSREWGYDRGLPVDRYYIEGFLARHAEDVRGRVLEVGDDSYTRRYGGDRVTVADVLDVTANNPRATVVVDLNRAEQLPSETFDCIILTQTLHLIYDVQSALINLRRAMRSGGVLLATFPGLGPISQREYPGSWYWGFTTNSARRLFEDHFPGDDVRIEGHGNALAASAFLYGFAAEELARDELDYRDPCIDMLIAVRAVRRPEGP
jgi:SAM-dependent methyltransferase